MSDDTFAPKAGSDEDGVQDSVNMDKTDQVPEEPDSYEDAAPETDDDPYADEVFEWEDEELALARMYRPYTPPKQNQHVPLVITSAKLDQGDYGLQLVIEADHLSDEFGDKPFPYRVYLSKKDDRNPNKIKYPMGTAFRATGVLTPDGTKGKKSVPYSELVPQLVGREFISRVYFVEKEDKKNSTEIETFWGEYGAVCNGDGEHLTETNKKSTDFGKALYYNPITDNLKVEGDVFADADDNPILDQEDNEIVFGKPHPILNEDTGFGAVGTAIVDQDGDKYVVMKTTIQKQERLGTDFIAMPDLDIEIDGEPWTVAYESAIDMLPPIKANTKVTAFNKLTGVEVKARYGFDSVWVLDTPISAGEVADVEDAGFSH